MKLLGVWLALASLLLAFDYQLKPQDVGEGIYCYFGKPEVMDTNNNGNMVNSCFVDMGKEWLVIDSGPTYLYAKEAYAQICRIKELPVKHVINTHVHDDHWLGNGYYKELGATILGSSAFEEISPDEATRMQNRISAQAYVLTSPKIPDRYIQGEKKISIANETLILKHVEGSAHSHSDLYLYLPSRKALFAGDLVFNDRIPSLRDGDISGWISVLEGIKNMDLNIIVGGHGVRTDKQAADFTLAYLKEMKQGIKEVLARGGDLSDAVKSLRMGTYENSKFYEEAHRANINAAFQMLEWE
ncbi:MAG: MBL fold metallo-hydrolase [Campylobacterales bacterium]|nr:MBL fold metallo-hydrolase [Campylobacterales bacterium]